MKIRSVTLMLSLSLVSCVALAQEVATRMVFVPIHVANHQGNSNHTGAFGSRWNSVLSASLPEDGRDPDLDRVTIPAAIPPCIFPCGEFPVTEGAVAYLRLMPGFGAESKSWVLEIEGERAQDLVMNLRVWDEASQFQEAGVEIPVLDVEDLPRGTVHLLDVPSPSDRYRSHLRLYIVPRSARAIEARGLIVRVWGYDSERASRSTYAPKTFLGERLIQLLPGAVSGLDNAIIHPAYAFVDVAQLFPDLADGRLKIEISSGDDSSLYAFVSTTNNQTNAVTVHLPVK